MRQKLRKFDAERERERVKVCGKRGESHVDEWPYVIELRREEAIYISQHSYLILVNKRHIIKAGESDKINVIPNRYELVTRSET